MSARDEILSRNLQCLRRKDPFLHTLLQTADDRALRAIPLVANNGAATLRVRPEGAGVVLLHSLYDPHKEAAALVRPALAEQQAAIYLVLGFGLGYHVRELLRATGEDSKILVVEKDPALFLCALRHADQAEVIDSPRVVFSVGDHLPLTQFKFKRLINFWDEPTVRVVEFPPALRLAAEYYQEVSEAVRDEFLVSVRNIGTLIYLSTLWQYNTLRNLEAIIKSPGVNLFEEERLFEDKTVILVSAGPSLNKNIDELRRVGDRAVIICVGTALKALLKHGIRPDIVVAVDGNQKMMGQFEGVDLEGLFLVSSSCLYPDIVEMFPGRTFFFAGGNEILSWLTPMIGDKGALAVGGTVAVSALDLAVRGGAKTVVLVGQDLAYLSDGTTHAAGTMYDGQKGNVKQWRKVPGNYEDEVYTDSMFYTYLKIMERLVTSFKGVRVVNATAGGAKIKGTELMPLSRAIDELCLNEKGSMRETLARAQERYVISNFDVLLMSLEEACQGLEKLEAICGEAVALCNRLIHLTKVYYEDSLERIQPALKRLEEIDAEMVRMEEFNKLLAMTIRAASFGVSTKQREEEKRMSKAVFANRRSREFYEQIVGASVWTRRILASICEKMEKERERELAAVAVNTDS